MLTFAQALAWGVAAAVAIGIGGTVAWGGKDLVHDNIDRWAGSARSISASSVQRREGGDVAVADGGTDLVE